MKNLYLLINDIKRLFNQNKLIFYIVIISMAVSTFGYLFYSGFILKNYLEVKREKGVVVSINVKKPIDKGNLTELCNMLGYGKEFINEFYVSKSEGSLVQRDVYEFVGEFNSNYYNYSNWVSSGAYYSSSENRPLMCISQWMVQPLFGNNVNPINRKVQIDGVDFIVCSMISFMYYDHYSVPVKYFIENFPVGYVKAMYNDNLSESDLIEIQRNLKKYKENIMLQIVKPQSPLLSFKFWMQIIQIIIIFILIIISLFIIIAYWIKRNRKIFNIYSIVGGSRVRVQSLIILQTFLLLVIGGALGGILFFSLQGILANRKLVQYGFYTVYLSIIFIVFVVLFLFTVFTSKKSNTGNQIYIIKD